MINILWIYLFGCVLSVLVYIGVLKIHKSSCQVSDLIIAFMFSWFGVIIMAIIEVLDFLYDNLKNFLNMKVFDFTDKDN